MHIMIDIETLAVHPTAAFFEVAAVPFDLDPVFNGIEVEQTPLHLHIDPSNQIDSGKFSVDWNTLKWWKTQPQSWEGYEYIPTERALETLSGAFRWDAVEGIWSKGPAFDIAILEHAYHAYNLKAPWSHRSVWDVRTIQMLAKTGHETSPSHDALEDALSQVKDVQEARSKLLAR